MYQNENTKICMFILYMYVDILFSRTKTIPIMIERVITYNQTLQTWIGNHATRYHNFNVLPHALTYIFSRFSMVLGYLQHVTTRYRQICKYIYIYSLVMRGNTFSMNKSEVTERYGNFSNSANMDRP